MDKRLRLEMQISNMDFSTLEKRRVACLREIEIKQCWAPDLYIGCVPITREPDGKLALHGEGEIVEWGVHMRRFDQHDLLSAYTERNQLDPRLATQLADAVFASHSKAQTASPAPGAAYYRDLVTTICRGLAAANVFDACTLARLTATLKERIEASAQVIDERAVHGFVRRCHVDLHLGNIVLHHGRATLYDAIDFDEALATIDTLYDLAFLLMDLDIVGHRLAANVVLNSYLYRSGHYLDLSGLAALPLFLSLRAAIRALVTSDRASQEDGRNRERDLAGARRYLAAALEYAELSAPRLVVVAGLSGTGKTTLAAALAPWLGAAPGAVHLRSDLERKALAGVGELERLPATAYTRSARERVYRSLHDKTAAVLRAHHAVIVDAVYDTEQERRDIEGLASALNIQLQGLWLQADAATLVARVDARRDDASDATAEVVHLQLTADIGSLSACWQRLCAGGNPDETLLAARLDVGNNTP